MKTYLSQPTKGKGPYSCQILLKTCNNSLTLNTIIPLILVFSGSIFVTYLNISICHSLRSFGENFDVNAWNLDSQNWNGCTFGLLD